MASISSAGIGSGLDVNSLVTQLVAAEAAPTQLRLDRREAEYQAQLSALGSFKGALSAFQDTLTQLKDLATFQGRIARSSNEAVFTATANSASPKGTFDVEVVQLAQAHKLRSDPYATVDTVLGNGTLTFTVGTDAFAVALVDGANTLADLRDAINASEQNTSLFATVVTGNDGAHLVLTSAATGAAEAIRVQVSGDPALDAFLYDPGAGTTNLTELSAAQDAQILVDGLAADSASNTVTGVIEGVTMTLELDDPGFTHTLDVDYDLASTRLNVQRFVDGYNEVLSVYNSATSFDAESLQSGPLLGDSAARTVFTEVRKSLGEAVEGLTGPFRTLAEIGITTTDDGSLELDTAKLDTALADDFDEVGRLFSTDNGVAVRLDDLIESFLASDGRLEVRTEGIQARIDGISEQRASLDQRLLALEARYRAQFTALDSLLSELTTTSAFLTQQLSNLPGFRPQA